MAVFPPCLLRYFNVNFKKISPATLCSAKANGNMTVYELQVNVTGTSTPPPVDVYNTQSCIYLYFSFIIGFDCI